MARACPVTGAGAYESLSRTAMMPNAMPALSTRALSLVLASAAVAAGPPGGGTATRAQCPNNSTSYCPTAKQCCAQKYSPSHFGCAPSYNYSGSDEGCGDVVLPDLCCKMGPAEPMNESIPNCIVIGDSVSIGYTGIVAQNLSGVCKVQHAPWDVSDGGAGSTARGVACLENFLVTQEQLPYKADVILFNFGLHDMTNGSRCEQVYLKQLLNISHRLLATKAKIGFLTTTPFMPKRSQNDTVVEDMNLLAVEAMKSLHIPVYDLYGVVTKRCGRVYKDCEICRVHPCSFHYNADGERLQAAAVEGAFRVLLKEERDEHRRPNKAVLVVAAAVVIVVLLVGCICYAVGGDQDKDDNDRLEASLTAGQPTAQ
eukprot:SAG22_NODE_498_length_9728_cov_12.354346_4_plen_370_part_00